MTGGDAEVGAHLTQSTKYDLYAGVGPYYFSSSHASSWGGKARLLGRFKEYASLEVSYSYDHLFRSIVQGSVGISYPFGKKVKRKGNNCTSQANLALSRAAFAPYRFEIPVVKRVTRRKAAINSATGDPWNVWFVNNTSSSAGTFESPFPTLLQAQNASGPNDMIYVFPGDGTTNGMNMGIALQNDQTFFGSGISHQISTTKGNITIPAFSTSAPSITNSGGSVITLANGDTISGFNILVQNFSTGILGNAGTNGANIFKNSISSLNPSIGHTGIQITGHGNFIIKNNQLINGASNQDGILIDIDDGFFANTTIMNNLIENYAFGIQFGPAISAPTPTTASGNTIISQNSISNFTVAGIIYSALDNSTAEFNNNSINNTLGLGNSAGIEVLVSNAPSSGNVTIQENAVISSTSNSNFGIRVLNTTSQNTNPISISVGILDNIVSTGSGAGSIGIDVLTSVNGSSICSLINGNTVTPQASSGTNDMVITASGTAVINLDNNFNNVASDIQITGNVDFVPSGTCEQ
jgi:hypothetical protein